MCVDGHLLMLLVRLQWHGRQSLENLAGKRAGFSTTAISRAVLLNLYPPQPTQSLLTVSWSFLTVPAVCAHSVSWRNVSH